MTFALICFLAAAGLGVGMLCYGIYLIVRAFREWWDEK